MPIFLILAAIFFLLISPLSPVADTMRKNVLGILSRANRNNNPGNLRYAGQAGTTGSDPAGFAVFATLQDGWNALVRQWSLYAERGYSLAHGIAIYAPSNENNTSAYLNFLTSELGVGSSTPLSDINLNALAQAIAKYEGFVDL